ncbi:MAG: DUF4382 domain-containing protein, partial [Betaproteobacteria bacterium]
PPSASNAVLSISVAGGASPGIDHMWVTVTGFAMHADASQVYGNGDAGWVTQPLDQPVTLDLASATLSQGQSQSLLRQTVTALGSYAQLRLIVASSDANASLKASATAAGLVYNDQVQYTDAGGVHVVPLEIPDPQAGIRLLSPFSLSGDATTPLSIEWNAHASLVRRASPTGVDRFALRDELVLYNQQLLTALGDGNLQIDGSVFDSISGQLDTTQFCTGASHVGCIHDVIASATSLSADTRFHQEVRSVNVAASGSFVLYPLPTQTVYDVVIHGGNMQTLVVRGVFVDPTGLLKPFPTALSSVATPIVPTLDTTEHAVTVTNALAPRGSRVFFGQTIGGSGGTIADLPYTIAYDAADPATGAVLHAVTLPGGPLHDAVFDPKTQGLGTPPPFTTVTQKEGLGAWSVWSQGTLADGTSSLTTLAAAAAGVVAPAPPRLAGFADGTLTLTLAGTPSNAADRAEAVVTDGGGTVAVVDISSLIAHGGATPITVPTGSASGASGAAGAARYGVAVHTWKTGSELASSRWARQGAPVDMTSATTASVTLNLP